MPELLQAIPGRWVIFRDGKVQSDFTTEQEAYDEAMARFGPVGGFIVVRIEKEEPTSLSPLFIYNLG